MQIKQEKFHILQYGNIYRMQKVCSITGALYKVDLDSIDYYQYYTKSGKKITHLKEKLNKNDLFFLETTLTPMEVKSLPSLVRKNTSKKLWRTQLRIIGLKDN